MIKSKNSSKSHLNIKIISLAQETTCFLFLKIVHKKIILNLYTKEIETIYLHIYRSLKTHQNNLNAEDHWQGNSRMRNNIMEKFEFIVKI